MNINRSTSKLRKASVLLIDDQAMVAEALRRQLADQSDIELHFCSSADNAFSKIEEVKPTVILQDLVMPDISGIDLLKRIRGRSTFSQIPVILLSSNDNAQTKFEAFSAGANDYVVKFPEKIELLGRIRCHSDSYHNLLERDAAEQERMRVAAQLQQKSKLESVGRLSAGIAHEINTPAQYIANNLGFIKESLDSIFTKLTNQVKNDKDLQFLISEIPAALNESIKGISQISSIVKAMNAYCSPGTDKPSSINLLKVVENVAVMCRNASRDVAEIKVSALNALPEILGRESDLNQAFFALIINSIEAINERKSKEQDFKGLIDITLTLQPDSFVNIAIKDNGCGIREEIRSKIFDPFFTTKEVGKGSGQGLTLVRSIIEDGHSGSISVNSTAGVGSEFVIKIPHAHKS